MKLIFGTMNLGQQVFGDEAVRMLRAFHDAGGRELDTAYVYNDGACEELVGQCLAALPGLGFGVATKANPRVTGRLDRAAVHDQLDGSLKRLGLDRVDVLYLHFPDPATPVEEPIRALAEAHAQGKFRELGVSNFPLSLVCEMLPLCDGLGCPRPTVYEGVYNALSRKAERELFPALDGLGMRFYAYNPLAGGMLTGRYRSVDEEPSGGRFALRAKSYKGRYWRESYFEAVGIVSRACEEAGIPVAEAAYRWLSHHSKLEERRGDGVIVGASSEGQLHQNLASLDAGPLPPRIVDAMEEAWALTEADSPEYYRFNEAPEGKGR